LKLLQERIEKMWVWIHKFGSPRYYYGLAGAMLPWFGWAAAASMLAGLYFGLVVAPPDYQQGESYRIIYVHVPAAWMSLFIYTLMAGAATVGLVWRIKLAHIVVSSSAVIGASFTFLALVTGSLWGKPMWGTWWEWDGRMTSELILLFLYLGFIALESAIEDRRVAARAGAILVLVGVVNIPIIHYSVEWWTTLHQGSTVVTAEGPKMAASMLWPLLMMALGFKLFYVTVLLIRTRCAVLVQEANSAWVGELVEAS